MKFRSRTIFDVIFLVIGIYDIVAGGYLLGFGLVLLSAGSLLLQPTLNEAGNAPDMPRSPRNTVAGLALIAGTALLVIFLIRLLLELAG
jgi:hypothetical protein